jgi:dTMP kinase
MADRRAFRVPVFVGGTMTIPQEKGELDLIDGPESAGKTTNAKRLVAHLRSVGRRVEYVREPGTDEVAEEVRKVLLKRRAEGKVVPLAEFFLFLASRAQVLATTVRPLLAAGITVVLDRYSLSTIAYQVAGRQLPLAPCLSALELATGGLVPDVTILLTCSFETSCARQKADGKELDRLELEGEDYHRRVIQAYSDFAPILPTWNIHTIQTDGLTKDGVFEQILDVVS